MYTISEEADKAADQHKVPKRLQAKKGPGLNIRMTTLTLFGPIARQRVNDKQPPKNGDDLDIDRCAALHNTLLLYGWVCSGKRIPQMEKKSWWSRHGNDDLKKLLRPSVVRYLSKVFDVPGHNFFYHVSGLASPKDVLQLGEVLEDAERSPSKDEKHRFIVLYSTSRDHVTHPAGIVYDQQEHRAIFMPTYNHVFNFKDTSLPWQPLESILSAYIDMVEAEKAIALHDSVGQAAEGPATEIKMGNDRVQFKSRPWVLQAYTKGDLEACLNTWLRLVEAIEKRADPLGLKRSEEDDAEPLASRTALTVAGIPRGFAYDLLSHANYSHVWYVAPGVRLPKVEEFLNQPFKKILQQYPKETEGMKMPFLFLRAEGTVSAKEAKFRWPFSTIESVPCGLYLDAFPNAQNPFEDACRFVLPIKLGGNRYARTADFKPIIRSHSDLYQTGINPFVMRHGPKLVAILENWLEHIERGHWQVDEKGVTGGIDGESTRVAQVVCPRANKNVRSLERGRYPAKLVAVPGKASFDLGVLAACSRWVSLIRAVLSFHLLGSGVSCEERDFTVCCPFPSAIFPKLKQKGGSTVFLRRRRMCIAFRGRDLLFLCNSINRTEEKREAKPKQNQKQKQKLYTRCWQVQAFYYCNCNISASCGTWDSGRLDTTSCTFRPSKFHVFRIKKYRNSSIRRQDCEQTV